MSIACRFAAKSVLVTGANRGIGLEFVRQFLELSTPPKHIFATCRNPDKAKDLCSLSSSKSNLHIFKLSNTDYDGMQNTANVVSDIVGDCGMDVLINNGATRNSAVLDRVMPDDMMENFQVNAVGPLMMTKAFLPLLHAATISGTSTNHGSALDTQKPAVFNISSKGGSVQTIATQGTPYLGRNIRTYPYWTSKAALNMITVLLGKDLENSGILVMALDPGWTHTAMGGTDAQQTVDTSVHCLINIMNKAKQEDVRFFHTSDGTHLPW